MSSISIRDVHVNYEQIEALKNVSFDIRDGEFIGIIGPNGGGKSTLVKTILGLLKPSQGNVVVEKGAVLGYVPQFTTFDRSFPISVEDVILTGHLPKKFKLGKSFSAHEKEHAREVMAQLGIEDLSARQIGALSGGQMQRVLIARALMNHPTVLVLDEPTSGVDEQSRNAIYNMLRALNQTMTILMITHDTDEIMSSFDRVIYINRTVHIHDETKTDRMRRNITGANEEEDVDTANCPINWFVEGEKIQRELMLVNTETEGEDN